MIEGKVTVSEGGEPPASLYQEKEMTAPTVEGALLLTGESKLDPRLHNQSRIQANFLLLTFPIGTPLVQPYLPLILDSVFSWTTTPFVAPNGGSELPI